MIIFTPNTVIKSADVNLNFDEFTSKGFVTPDSAWSVIGDAGKPAFENGWSNYDATEVTFYKAGYYKDSMGWVHLRGIVKSGTVGAGVAMFTLPVGYRPSKMIRLVVCSNNTSGAFGINSGGVCYLEAGSNAFVFLENVIFKAS